MSDPQSTRAVVMSDCITDGKNASITRRTSARHKQKDSPVSDVSREAYFGPGSDAHERRFT